MHPLVFSRFIKAYLPWVPQWAQVKDFFSKFSPSEFVTFWVSDMGEGDEPIYDKE